ncbi:MAG TPA: DUF3596 domain-containing protein [Nostocaceae cyanobacterium]|nr:DUF3596 domain-containing protein [Nostocaceae cyanobacterium]
MDDDKWISKDKRTERLLIRFRVKGFPKQFNISTGLEDTKKNRAKVREIRDIIQQDIKLGRFDYTLEDYQFDPIKNSKSKPQP